MAETNGDEPFDVDAFLDGYVQRTEKVTLYPRGDLVGEMAQLEAELGEVSMSGQSDDDGHVDRAKDLLGRLQEAEAQLEASGVTFTVAACSHERWYTLQLENPASDVERKTNPNAVVGTEFQVKALAECSHEPKVTVAQARKMREDMRPDDFDRLWAAVITCCEGAVVPKSQMATAVASLFDGHSTNRKARRSRGASGRAANGGRSRSTSTTKKAS